MTIGFLLLGLAQCVELNNFFKAHEDKPREFKSLEAFHANPADPHFVEVMKAPGVPKTYPEGTTFDDLVTMAKAAVDREASGDESFLEVSAQTHAQVKIVRQYCEVCILVMQMKERGQPFICEGLVGTYWNTCVEVLESLLNEDKALVYWLKTGCMHMDNAGPEVVAPCPALNICSWTPNMFADSPSLTRDGNEGLCPKDYKFLPTVAKEFRNALEKKGG